MKITRDLPSRSHPEDGIYSRDDEHEFAVLVGAKVEHVKGD